MLQGVSAETQISAIIISVKELKRHFNQKMFLVLTLTVQIVLFKADSATKGLSIKVYDGNLSLLSYRAEDSGRRGRDTFEVAARENAVDGTESTAVLSERQLLIGSHL